MFDFHISSENPVKMKDSSNYLLFKVNMSITVQLILY